MTKFIDSFSTEQLLPPWYSKGARNWAFVIEVPPHCIQDYLDTHLNAPGPDVAPWHWQAISDSSHGVLLVSDHGNFSSGAMGGTGWKQLAHKEVFWFFPAYRYQRTPDNLLVGDPAIVWIQPFALDDNSYVMFSSREIWGCEKDMATILTYEGEQPGDLHLDLAIEGCKTFAPRSISHQIGAIHIRMTPPAQPFDWKDVFGDADLARLTGDFLGGVMMPTQPAGTGAPQGGNVLEINTLKQFRDVFDLRCAAYRAIIASRVTHSEVTNPQFYPGDAVEIDFMWSDSLAEKFERLFGLEQPTTDTVPSGHPAGLAASGVGIDWDMPRVRAKVKFAAAFTSDSHFEVLGTMHTYGLGPRP